MEARGWQTRSEQAPNEWETGENLTTQQLFNRLTFVLCQVAQSSMRIETALDEIADKLDSLIALAQQRSDIIRAKRRTP